MAYQKLQAGLAAAGLVANVRNLSSEGLRQEGFNVLLGAIGAAGNTNVSGVSQTFFPKSGGSGGARDTAIATAAVVGLSSLSSAISSSQAKQNPAAQESAARQQNRSNFQANGNAGGVNEANANFNNQGSADRAALNAQVSGT